MNDLEKDRQRETVRTKRMFEILARPHSMPVLTDLPPGYSNWETEADLEARIERLRAWGKWWRGCADAYFHDRTESLGCPPLEPGDLGDDD